MTGQAALTLDHVGKTFAVDGRPLTALSDISLSVRAGEFVSLVGASGCGKSTLLRLLIGLDPGFSGTITIDGAPVTGPSLDRGIVFQEPRLLPWLTVEQNIAFGLANTPIPDAEKQNRVAEHIALVRLSGFEKALPRQLSGGMAQRVAIARALVNQPRLLLLDEPFGALDALTRAHLQDQLLDIWERQKVTAIFVTHDVEEAVYLSDRVVVMEPRPGRIRSIADIALPRPRHRTDAAFARQREEVLAELTGASGERDQPELRLVGVGGGR
ncbi:ABC transporter ATP-binding protein [Sphingomonas abietis]|uniref:ABC transporter ATP-binding protein n=1 Tax=Sphingomonas abietis TaxID=3012344 RepID=A0ABY7NIK4_9SPHN|nr:ABC transporter ATP-binding protein [Sphingomonas abietis]WBO21356.1 ABC transporter ATP-binding protein [Sphingomonas abietis]